VLWLKTFEFTLNHYLNASVHMYYTLIPFLPIAACMTVDCILLKRHMGICIFQSHSSKHWVLVHTFIIGIEHVQACWKLVLQWQNTSEISSRCSQLYTSTLAKRSTGRDIDKMLVIIIEYTEINNCVLHLLREQHRNRETQY
jgi:hypothetical protein